jgi:hypothetical protein
VMPSLLLSLLMPVGVTVTVLVTMMPDTTVVRMLVVG